MKVCDEFVKDLRLKTRRDGQEVFYHYYGVPNYRMCDGQWIKEPHCAWCNEPFFKRLHSNTVHCSEECRNLHSKLKKEERRKEKKLINAYKVPKDRKGRKWSEEAKLRMKEVYKNEELRRRLSERPQCKRTGVVHPTWKGGVSKSRLTSYDTYFDKIPSNIQTRRDPDNRYVLQTVCEECGKWFSPKNTQIKRKIVGQVSWNFHCSPQCAGKKRRGISYVSEETKKSRKAKLILKQKKSQLKESQKKLKLASKKYKRILARIHRMPYSIDKYNKSIERKKLKAQKQAATIEKNQEKQIIFNKFKKEHYNIYKKYSKNKAGLWFEIKRYQSPIEWRAQRLFVLSNRRAKNNGWKTNITKKWLIDHMTKCEATGMPFDLSYEGTFMNRNPYAPSIDRIDSNKGYTTDNCRLVLTVFNFLKSTLSDNDLYSFLKQFVQHYEKNLHL